MNTRPMKPRRILSAIGGALLFVASMLAINTATADASATGPSGQSTAPATTGNASAPGVGASLSDWQAWAAQQRHQWTVWAQPILKGPRAVQFSGEYAACTLEAFDVHMRTTSGGHGMPAGLALPTAWAKVDCPPNARDGVALFHIAMPGQALPWLPGVASTFPNAGRAGSFADELNPHYKYCETITGPGKDCLGYHNNPSGIVDFGSYLYEGSSDTSGYLEFSRNGSPPNGCSIGSFISASPTMTLHHGQKAVALATPGMNSYFASTWWGANARQDWGTVCDLL